MSLLDFVFLAIPFKRLGVDYRGSTKVVCLIFSIEQHKGTQTTAADVVRYQSGETDQIKKCDHDSKIGTFLKSFKEAVVLLLHVFSFSFSKKKGPNFIRCVALAIKHVHTIDDRFQFHPMERIVWANLCFPPFY